MTIPSLVMMYVYYDQNNDIKAITPSLDPVLEKQYTTITMPLRDVEPFLTGRRNTFDYTIKRMSRHGGDKYTLARKGVNINLTRTEDRYLTKVEHIKSDGVPIVKITGDAVNQKLYISLDPAFKDLLWTGTEDQKNDVSEFINRPPAPVYLTKQGNPYHILHTTYFLPKQLFDEEKLRFDVSANVDIENTDAYTKKIVSSYGYYVRKQNVI